MEKETVFKVLNEIEKRLSTARSAMYYIREIDDPNEDVNPTYKLGLYEGYKQGMYDGFEASMGLVEKMMDEIDFGTV